jgi:hypothetical protein
MDTIPGMESSAARKRPFCPSSSVQSIPLDRNLDTYQAEAEGLRDVVRAQNPRKSKVVPQLNVSVVTSTLDETKDDTAVEEGNVNMHVCVPPSWCCSHIPHELDQFPRRP